jgi:fructose-1-phosphate kinase PfkB-like protein
LLGFYEKTYPCQLNKGGLRGCLIGKIFAMPIKKAIILEFAPTADEIWNLSRHNKDGYASHDAENGLVSILDTAHDAKPRPEIMAVYAGGKATNVARVMDRLIDKINGQIELVTFLPPPQGVLCELQPIRINDTDILPSTPSGIYVQCLQVMNLKSIKPRFEVINELEETDGMQVTRRCIEIIIKDTGTSLNFSPRIVWSQKTADAILSRLEKVISSADMVIMAGAPPVWKSPDENSITSHDFYAEILHLTNPECEVSVDVRGYYLHKCLVSDKPPRFIFMNKDEFLEASESWRELSGKNFSGTIIAHDKDGCWVWDRKLPNIDDLFGGAVFYPSPKVDKVYSTIGAGDAMHAGFLKEWIFYHGNRDRLARSVVYSQAVSAVSVSNEKATYGIEIAEVDEIFGKSYYRHSDNDF